MRKVSGESGISLIELLVVVSIIGILIAAFGISFEGWRENYRIESQVKDIYADLLDARTKALTQGRIYFVGLSETAYQIVQDTNEDGIMNDTPPPQWTTPKKYNYGFKLKRKGGSLPVRVTIDTRGLISPQDDFRIDHDTSVVPDSDCIAITQAKIRIGKYNTTSSQCDEK